MKRPMSSSGRPVRPMTAGSRSNTISGDAVPVERGPGPKKVVELE